MPSKKGKHVHRWTIDRESGMAWCLVVVEGAKICCAKKTLTAIERILNRYERQRTKKK